MKMEGELHHKVKDTDWRTDNESFKLTLHHFSEKLTSKKILLGYTFVGIYFMAKQVTNW